MAFSDIMSASVTALTCLAVMLTCPCIPCVLLYSYAVQKRTDKTNREAFAAMAVGDVFAADPEHNETGEDAVVVYRYAEDGGIACFFPGRCRQHARMLETFRCSLSAAPALGRAAEAGVIFVDKLPLKPTRRMNRAGLIAMLEAELKYNELEKHELTAVIFSLKRPARVIACAYRRATSDPHYALCRARLRREFEALLRELVSDRG